jgi:alkylated DNA repair dioxygenase AlkB
MRARSAAALRGRSALVHHAAVSARLPFRFDSAASLPLPLRDGHLELLDGAFAPRQADDLLARLRDELPWSQESLVIFGRRHAVPRLVSWHGDPGAHYRYSGVLHEPLPWTPALLAVRERVEALAGRRFNSVLANLYRDGRDGMGWHADDEPELGPEPVIASVSLGATRRFRLRHRTSGETRALALEHGSLLVMSGALQRQWLHCVPKTARPVGPRINLTFREILRCPDPAP